jgi:hypothetical protein
MTTEQIKTEFYAFLKKHNALTNWKKYSRINTRPHFFTDSNEKNISGAFPWYITSEGVEFWGELSKKWVEHYNNLIK